MPGEKRRAESPIPLEQEQRELNDSIRVAKKRVRAPGSFNAKFWANSGEMENLILRRTENERKISLRDFSGPKSEWEQTDAAKALFQRIKAQQTAVKMCKEREEELEGSKSKKRSLRAVFMKLFTTSKMGLGILTTGAGKWDSTAQSAFRADLIRAGDASHPEEDWIWCPVLGTWCPDSHTQAAHLFPHAHGQDVMDAIFGKKRPAELFSPKNGLLVASVVEKYFDCGKLVIVPDLPDRPAAMELLAWAKQETREYKLKIIDPTWEKLDKRVEVYCLQTWREIDGRRLQFRTDSRPAARYLYFHYCIQVLRQAWAHNAGGGSLATLKDEVGKPFWGTPGRYMPKNMLLALVEELGHEYSDLLNGACSSKGDESILLAVASSQIKKRPALRELGYRPGPGEESEEGSGESDDSEEEGSSHGY